MSVTRKKKQPLNETELQRHKTWSEIVHNYALAISAMVASGAAIYAALGVVASFEGSTARSIPGVVEASSTPDATTKSK